MGRRNSLKLSNGQQGSFLSPARLGGVEAIARRSRGTPRIANRLLRRVRDFAEVRSNGEVTGNIAEQALDMLEVDEFGLDVLDRRL